MNSIDIAIKKDIRAADVCYSGELLEESGACQSYISAAADEYEALIERQNATVDVVVNLAFLYWQVTETGFSLSCGLDWEFISHAEARYPEIIRIGESRWIGNVELEFWKSYFRYVSIADIEIEQLCEVLIEQCANACSAFFPLFVSSHGRRYRAQTQLLYDLCKKTPTFKNRYVNSVLNSSEVWEPLD